LNDIPFKQARKKVEPVHPQIGWGRQEGGMDIEDAHFAAARQAPA